MVALAERIEAVDLGAGVDRDVQQLDLLELLVEQVGRQAVGRNAIAQHPPGLLLCLEDLDPVAVGAQVIGRRQARGTGADDADALAGIGRDLGPWIAAVGEAVLGGLGLQRTDEDGPVAAAANAGRFARRRADQAADQRQRVVAPDHLDGGTVVAMTEVGDEARDVDVGRTGAVAGRRAVRQVQAQAFRARVAPDMLLPLLAEVAQGTAQGPGRSQPLSGELERHAVEGGEMVRLAAAEGDLGREARGARQQRAHRCSFAIGKLPVAIERASGLLDHAHALGHHHEAGRRRDDTHGRERERIARQVRRRERQEAAQPVVEDEHGVTPLHLDAAAPVVDLAPQVPRARELHQAALLHAASERQQRSIEV